jgi:hypothetical protein
MFADFRGQPVLDRALQTVAALRGDDRKRPDGCVIRAAEGFISDDAAHQLAIGMLGMLHKVSPPYSVSAWWVVLGLPVVAAFFVTEYFAEPTPDWSALFLTSAGMAVVVLSAIVLLSPLAWLMSALVSWARRLRVPAAYRQKGRNWEPLKFVCGGALVAAILGTAYAGTVRLGWLPSLGSTSLRTAHWISDRARALPVVESWLPKARAPVTTDYAAADNETEMYREIQRRLLASGYPVGKPDGKWGPRTAAQLAEYLNRERLPAEMPAREVLEHMRKTAIEIDTEHQASTE